MQQFSLDLKEIMNVSIKYFDLMVTKQAIMVTLLASFCLFFSSFEFFLSVLVGSCIMWLSSLISMIIFLQAKHFSPRKILKRLYYGEACKWVITIVMFIVSLYYLNFKAVGLLTGFSIMQFGQVIIGGFDGINLKQTARQFT